MTTVTPVATPIASAIARALTAPGVGGEISLAGLQDRKAEWNVNDLSTLFTTAAGSTPATVGMLVGRIEDKSGFGQHLTAVDAERAYLRQRPNGTYYLEGDGTLRRYSIAGSAGYFKFLHDGTGGSGCIVAGMGNAPANSLQSYVMNTNGVTTSLAGFGVSDTTGTGTGTRSYLLRIGNGSASVFSGGPFIGDMRRDGIVQPMMWTYKTQAGGDVYTCIDGGAAGLSTFGKVAEANTPTSANAYQDMQLFTTNAAAYFKGEWSGAVYGASEWTVAERQLVSRWAASLVGNGPYLLGVGDSHTFNASYGQYLRDFYPARLETLLRAGGISRTSVNKGVSGNSTANIIARLATVTETGNSNTAIIYAGTNDLNAATTVQAAPTPTTTTFNVAAGKGVYYAAGGQITVNGVVCTILSTATDSITLTAPLGFTPTAGQAVVIDTQANLVTIGNALKAAGYSQLIVCGQHYLNFASGGDTVATPLSSTVALRALQSAAATTLGALYVDFHAYMRDLIVAGTYTQGDDTAWHVAVGNTHLNNTGEQILADAIFAAMQAQGWA